MKRITSQESFRYILKNDGTHEEKFALCRTASLVVIFFLQFICRRKLITISLICLRKLVLKVNLGL